MTTTIHNPTQETIVHSFDHDPEMEAAIEAKIETAVSQGVDLSNLDPNDGVTYGAVMQRIGVTRDEQEYMARRTILRMTQVFLGQKIIETLNAGNFRMERADLIPCLTAYFEAVEAGEVEAA